MYLIALTLLLIVLLARSRSEDDYEGLVDEAIDKLAVKEEILSATPLSFSAFLGYGSRLSRMLQYTQLYRRLLRRSLLYSAFAILVLLPIYVTYGYAVHLVLKQLFHQAFAGTRVMLLPLYITAILIAVTIGVAETIVIDLLRMVRNPLVHPRIESSAGNPVAAAIIYAARLFASEAGILVSLITLYTLLIAAAAKGGAPPAAIALLDTVLVLGVAWGLWAALSRFNWLLNPAVATAMYQAAVGAYREVLTISAEKLGPGETRRGSLLKAPLRLIRSYLRALLLRPDRVHEELLTRRSGGRYCLEVIGLFHSLIAWLITALYTPALIAISAHAPWGAVATYTIYATALLIAVAGPVIVRYKLYGHAASRGALLDQLRLCLVPPPPA